MFFSMAIPKIIVKWLKGLQMILKYFISSSDTANLLLMLSPDILQ